MSKAKDGGIDTSAESVDLKDGSKIGESMKWKCRSCGTDFEARCPHIDWRSGERVDPKCTDCNSYAVKPILDK